MILWAVTPPRREAESDGEDRRSWFGNRVEAGRYFDEIVDEMRAQAVAIRDRGWSSVEDSERFVGDVAKLAKVAIPMDKTLFVEALNAGFALNYSKLVRTFNVRTGEFDENPAEVASHG